MNLAAVLLDRAPMSSEHTAFVFGDARVSRAALRRRMLSAAAQMRRSGARPGDRVAIRLPNGPDFVAAWLAAQWIGAVAVQLPVMYRRREIERIVSDSGASLIVSELEAVEAGTPGDLPPHPQQPGEPATLTYITAADGPLRGVIQTAADVLASYDAYARGVLAMGPTDVCAGALGLGWAYGFGALLAFPMLAGATSVVLDDAESLMPSIVDHRATILFAVPTTYRMLLRHPLFDAARLRSLRCCVSAGEPLPAEVADEWRGRTGLELLDGLGTTELTHIVVSARPGCTRSGFIGRPVDGYDARIVDENGDAVADGEQGRLAVRGPTRARYWNDPDAERRAFQNGWTLTGDVAVRDRDGWFRHVRRADSLVVSAGYKISTREVEAALCDHPDVRSARVEERPDAVRGATLHAAVTAASHADKTALAERLRVYLKSELAPFKCPRTFESQ